jgi:histidinol-phosphate/aromatic aminotransferase/cobyric acid decarboxylase-like protein
MRAEIAKYINEKVYTEQGHYFSTPYTEIRPNNPTQVTFTQDSISYRSSAPTAARLPAAAATHLNNILSPDIPIQLEHIVIADSATSLGNILGYNLAERGEGILVNRPVYGRFELDYGVEAGVEMVYADTATEEAFSPTSVDKYEQALEAARGRGMQIRAVLLVNPHNPVGVFCLMLGISNGGLMGYG